MPFPRRTPAALRTALAVWTQLLPPHRGRQTFPWQQLCVTQTLPEAQSVLTVHCEKPGHTNPDALAHWLIPSAVWTQRQPLVPQVNRAVRAQLEAVAHVHAPPVHDPVVVPL